MPIPPGFDNTVRRVTASPVAAADLNTELTTQLAAGYLVTDIRFTNTDNAFLLFAKDNAVAYGYNTTQKVNLVTQTQAALDADKASEEAINFYPTGIFATPGGDLLVLYAKLVISD